jgi:hypothetical protein
MHDDVSPGIAACWRLSGKMDRTAFENETSPAASI